MKIRFTMKTPDMMDEISRQVARYTKDDDETEVVTESVMARWFKYGEYLMVEIDTEANTGTVIPVEMS